MHEVLSVLASVFNGHLAHAPGTSLSLPVSHDLKIAGSQAPEAV
jgi:hypothetical protein